MIELIMEIFGFVMLLLSLLALLRYVIHNKKYKDSLKTFSISVIAFFIFSIMFSVVETILFYKVRVKSRVDGQVIFYIIISILYLWNVIVLCYISSYRLILNEDDMVYINVFGIKKRFSYYDVTKLDMDPISGYYKIYFGKKKIEVPYFVEDQQRILEYIKK